MNKQAALERLTALENEAAALRKVIEQPENKGLWKPEPDGKYYYVAAEGLEGSAHRTREDWNANTINHGNCFKSRELAEKASLLMARANKIIAAALQADDDAGEFRQGRMRTVVFCGGEWRADFWSSGTASAIPAHVHTDKQAQSMADILNAEGVK